MYLLDLYFSKFPKPPLEMDFLYLQPKPQKPTDPKEPWFNPNPIGKNTLQNYLSNMCIEAGIQEKKTNHSLRATGATAMFAAQVPEKMIKDVTGHKSSKALSLYEQPTVAQKQALSKVLPGSQSTSSGPTSFSTNLDKIQQVQGIQRSQHFSNTELILLVYFHLCFNCTINFSPPKHQHWSWRW